MAEKSLIERIDWNNMIREGGMSSVYPILDDKGEIAAAAKVIEITKITKKTSTESSRDLAPSEVEFREDYKTLSISGIGTLQLNGYDSQSLFLSQNEKKMLEKFRGVENVVNIRGHEFICYEDAVCSVIKMDYVPGKLLHDYTKNSYNCSSLKDFAKAIADIASVLLYFECVRVIYGDMKACNIIYSPADKEGRGKTTLIDFNSVVYEDSPDNGKMVSTVCYLSPEQVSLKELIPKTEDVFSLDGQISSQKLTTKTDIFSLGGIIYRYFTGSFPDLTKGVGSYETKIKKMIQNMGRCGCPDNLLDATRKAMMINPKERSVFPLMKVGYEIARS